MIASRACLESPAGPHSRARGASRSARARRRGTSAKRWASRCPRSGSAPIWARRTRRRTRATKPRSPRRWPPASTSSTRRSTTGARGASGPIGRALARAFADGAAARDEVFVSTKGGYLPHDAEDARPGPALRRRDVSRAGRGAGGEIAQGCHCMSPGYLEDQIARSRENLGLETIDLYYLHNVETQLEEIGREKFRDETDPGHRDARGGGGLRKDRRVGTRDLERAAGSARAPRAPFARLDPRARDRRSRERGTTSEASSFRSISRWRTASAFRSQEGRGRPRARPWRPRGRSGSRAFGSASLLQGRLVGRAVRTRSSRRFPEAETPARRALQFSRSAPGMTTALVGVSAPEHAAENFGLASVAPAEPERDPGPLRLSELSRLRICGLSASAGPDGLDAFLPGSS